MYSILLIQLRMRRLHSSLDILLKELNGQSIAHPKDKPSKSAVNRLRQLCADLEELEQIRSALAQHEPKAADPVSTAQRLWAWPNLQLKHPASQELNARGERILDRVNANLNRLRTREGVMLAADTRGMRLIRWNPFDYKNFFTTGYMYLVLGLLDSRNLHRLRRCQRKKCRRWFFGQTDWQKYCSRNCRQLEAAHGEAFKEKRRLYMRKYRRNEIEQGLRAKELAKKGRKK